MLECSVPIGQSEVEGPMRSQATRGQRLSPLLSSATFNTQDSMLQSIPLAVGL